MDFAFEIYHSKNNSKLISFYFGYLEFMHRIYLINKKANLEALLAQHKARLDKLTLKNTERIDSGGAGNVEEALNYNSVSNNLAILREKEKMTFNQVSKSVFIAWGEKFIKKEPLINNELQGNSRDYG